MILRFTPSWMTAVIALVILSVYECFHPQGFFYDDSVYWFLPNYELNFDALKYQEIVQINFYQYLGYTPFVDSQSGIFYLPIYVGEALARLSGNEVIVIEWLCWVHLAAAALVVERFARLFRVSAKTSVLIGIYYMTQPMIFDAPQLCVALSYAYFFVPLVFLCIELFLRQPTFMRLLVLIAVKAVFIISGHINYFALSLLYEAVYITFSPYFLSSCKRIGSFQGLFAWLAANALCGICSLPVLGPLLRHLRESSERGQGFDLDSALILKENFVDFFKTQFDHSYSSQRTDLPYLFPDVMFFLGFFFIFTPLMMFRLKDPQVRFFLVLFVAALVFCTSAFSLIHSLPFYNTFRYPPKNFSFGVLFYCIAIGLLIQTSRHAIFKGAIIAVLTGGIVLNIVASYGYEYSPIGANTLFKRYDIAFQLPHEMLAKNRSVLVSMKTAFPDPNLLGFLFATQARLPVIQGYDPIVSKQNFEEALKANYQATLKYKLSKPIVDHLRFWSVRYYFIDKLSSSPDYITESPDFKKLYETTQTLIYEDAGYIPMVYFENDQQTAIPFTFEGNSVHLSTGGRTGTISLSLIPLQGYFWRYGSESNWSPVPVAEAGRLTFTIDKPSDAVVVRYFEPFLGLFCFISFFTFLSCLVYSCVKTRRGEAYLFSFSPSNVG